MANESTPTDNQDWFPEPEITADTLIKEHKTLRDRVHQYLNKKEQSNELLSKELEELKTEAEDRELHIKKLEFEIDYLNDKLAELQDSQKEMKLKIDELNYSNTELQDSHLMYIKDLEAIVKRINKRRRTMSYVLDSPLSPDTD